MERRNGLKVFEGSFFCITLNEKLGSIRSEAAFELSKLSTELDTYMLGGLGGFLGRKGDVEPGVKVIWQGYDKLLHYIEAADMFGV